MLSRFDTVQNLEQSFNPLSNNTLPLQSVTYPWHFVPAFKEETTSALWNFSIHIKSGNKLSKSSIIKCHLLVIQNFTWSHFSQQVTNYKDDKSEGDTVSHGYKNVYRLLSNKLLRYVFVFELRHTPAYIYVFFSDSTTMM